jgi:Rieske Fe-S protein
MVAAENDRPEGADAEVGRRVLLRGMAALGLAAVTLPLAACGSDDEPEAVSSTPEVPEATPEASTAAEATPKPAKSPKAEKTPKASPEASPKATEKPEATPKATPKDSGGKLVKDGTTPLASTSDIPVNSGMLFELDEYIVTQPSAGKFVGFDSLCTHQGCPVDVFDTPGEMDCSCHDSHFKITDGSVISGPAKKAMPMKPIIVEGGQIYKAKKA